TTKTINIVTKADMRSGQFGKMYAGYGYDDKYQGGGNINYFDGDRRISLIGMTNNINVQNFSADDLLGVMGNGGRGGGMGGRGGGGRQGGGSMGGGGGDFLVRPQGGIAVTTAVGLNYSDKWGDKTDVSASYFFNNSNAQSESTTYRQFLNNNGGLAELYDEENNTRSDNTNHRFNARIEFKLDSMNTFILRPRLSAQINDGSSATLGQTLFDTNLLSKTDNTYFSDLTGLNLNTDLLWRHRLTKKGRTLSLNMSSGYAPKNGTSLLQSADEYFIGPPRSTNLDQQSSLDIHSWNVAGNAEYTEPLTENAQLLFNYRLSFQQEASDKYTYDFFNPDQDYTQINEPLSNVFSNDYVTHQTGAGYNYSKGRDLNINFRTNVQWADLANQKTFPQPGTIDQTFFNVLPSAMLRYNVDRNRNIRFNYRSSTQLPSVDQLQDVLNNSNPLQLSVGNPNLKQTFQQNLFLRYQGSNPDRGSTFFAMINGGMTNNYIANATYLATSDHPILDQYKVPRGARISQPVNLNGYWTARTFVSYGQPIKGIKTNINLDLSYNFIRTPGLVNDVENLADNHTAGFGLTFASNISERVDFTLSARPSYNTVSNTLQTASNAEYFSQNSRLKFNWIVAEGFVLRTDVSHTLNSGLSDGFNQNFWLWHLAIGKKVFKNERGEIALAVNDLLGQNRSISRTITESYIEDLQTNALQRFVMLSFTYNLRHFSTGKAAKPRTDRQGDWGPPPGNWRG
ncbi:MAG: outer membrane beta-barrel protein, partial [Saprospiraceae bacterium]